MPRYVRITYQCPRCRTDIGRQFGLLTTRTIICPRCSAPVRIDTAVMAANWGFNFATFGGLLIWFGLAAGVLVSPEFAAQIGGKTFPAVTFENRLVIAMVSCVWGMIGAFFLYFLGAVLGAIAFSGSGGDSPPPEPEVSSQLGSAFRPLSTQGYQPLQTAGLHRGPTSAPPQRQTQTQTQQRGCLVRMFFIGFWPVFLFFGYVFGMAIYAQSAAENQEARNKLNEELAKQATPWILLAMLIVFILGCVGLMPWTGSKKRARRTA